MERDPEAIWAALLSRQPGRIRSAARGLTDEERGAVVAHLRRMALEEGWTGEQRVSARAALDALREEIET